MMMFRHLFYILLISINASSTAQDSLCKVSTFSFQVGEDVKYRAYYNWKFIWLDAGDVTFSVKDTLYRNKTAFHFISKGWSLKEYDWFFKVRDNFEAIVTKDNFQPLWFLRDTYEGGFKTFNRYNFDYKAKQLKIVSYTSERSYKEDYRNLPPCTYDVLSAIYYCRTIDFDLYSIGDRIPLTMAIDNDIYNLYIRYLGKENLKLHKSSAYNTIKFSVMLVEGTIFKGGEDMTIWVTDDANRIPVMVEAKILVGSVKAIITNASGLVNSSSLE